MFFGEICDSIRGKIDCRQKIKPKSDRLLEAPHFPCFAVPHLPFGGSIGKVNDERVRVKPIGGRAGMRHGLVTRRKMSFRDHKVSRVDIRRRRLGEVANC